MHSYCDQRLWWRMSPNQQVHHLITWGLGHIVNNLDDYSMMMDTDTNRDGLVNGATLSKQIIIPEMTVCNLQVQISISCETKDTAYRHTGSTHWILSSNREAGQGCCGQDQGWSSQQFLVLICWSRAEPKSSSLILLEPS